ncbi:pentapeptide repeat-containing protein [Streptomyces sp. NPDC088789]|uniref:pentapeptide repeat-containing protein n=1 Tax=Streptomyces sp. NPDC088789 TaxID=3365899 RepID=UPI0038168D54
MSRPRYGRSGEAVPTGRRGDAARPIPPGPGGLDWARRIELVSVLLASVAAVAGLWYSADQTRDANEQARQERALTKEGQITDRYTAAVENLGADKMDLRLGGIYALQRIMKDSPRDHPTICNVLAAYVRSHAAAKEGELPEVHDLSWPIELQNVPADVHAALTVLVFRDSAHDGDFRLDLRGTRLDSVELDASDPSQRAVLKGAKLSGMTLIHANLPRADLSGANLHGSTLSGADLTGVKLTGARLSHAALRYTDMAGLTLTDVNMTGTQLTGADLTGVTFHDTDLRFALLDGTELDGATLRGTDLSHANLKGASLRGADLRGADLSGVTNLTREQISSARIDGTTILPAGLS